MKIFTGAITFVLGFVFFSGCLQVNTNVKVNPDGSGTIEETVMMSNEVINMFKQFANSFSDDSTQKQEDFEMFKEEDAKKRASDYGEGVEYVSGEHITTDTQEGFKAIYSFKDLNLLKINQNPNSKLSMDELKGEGMGEDTVDVKEEYVNFQFIKGNPSEIIVHFAQPKEKEDNKFDNEESESDTASQNMAEMGQLKQILKDLKMTLSLELNGKIEETNATFVDNSKITLFEIDFGKLIDNPEKFKEFTKIHPNSLDELKEIVKGIPGIKIEMNEPMMVKFD